MQKEDHIENNTDNKIANKGPLKPGIVEKHFLDEIEQAT